MTDEDLVAGLLGKDGAAQQFLYENQREGMYRTAVYLLGWQDPDAEDCVQEALVQGLNGLESFEFRSTLQTWLNRICARQCYRRMEGRRRLLLGQDHDVADALKLAHGDDDALHALIQDEHREIIKKSLKGLKRACRKIIKLRDFEGQSYVSIAKKFKVPMGTVMSRLARCRSHLKDRVTSLVKGR